MFEGETQSIGQILEAGTRRDPRGTILQRGHMRLSYDQLHRAVIQAANQLAGMDIMPGNLVALLFEDTPECIVAFLALARLNAGLFPVEAGITATGLESLQEEAAFTSIVGHATKLRSLERSLGSRAGCYIEVENLLLGAGSARDVTNRAYSMPGMPFVYHYTSGSTGQPKAAVHSQANLVNGSIIYRHTFGIGPEDRILAAVPLLHSFGMVAGLLTALLTGARLLLPDRLSPHQILQTLVDEEATVLLAAPLTYDLIARAYPSGIPPLARLRLCLSSGAPLHLDTAERFRSRCGKAIYQVYGSTETGIIAAQRPDDPIRRQGSVGRPVLGVQVSIVDDQGQKLPSGATGNLLVQTPAMFSGYFQQPDEANRVFQESWYRTGDMARQDEDGLLYIVGRKDTFINVGGKKVNPPEVEEVLLRHPLVTEATVWGTKVGTSGEAVRAAVVTTDPLSATELFTFCRRHLLPHQVPMEIDFLDALPRSSVSKIRRVDLDVAVRSSRGRVPDKG
jgi:acyl-coenzyme A synthetase/AMP-(fatty) acid ligase